MSALTKEQIEKVRAMGLHAIPYDNRAAATIALCEMALRSLEATVSATVAHIEFTPEMMAACEAYYAKWQRIQGIHDPEQLKADCWSATHAMRAMLAAAPAASHRGEPSTADHEYICQKCGIRRDAHVCRQTSGGF